MLNDGTPGNEVEVYQDGTYRWIEGNFIAAELGSSQESLQDVDLEQRNSSKKGQQGNELVEQDESYK